LVIASNNSGKILEIKTYLGGYFSDIVSVREAGLDICLDKIETGDTLFENAFKKAEFVYKHLGLPVLADDSGLFVSALEGQPGVNSAHFAGKPTSDTKNNQKLLEALRGKADRSAYFECCLVLYLGADRQINASAKTDGIILDKEAGDNGFGYDPLFFYPPLNLTFAQMCLKQKQQTSHRGRALKKIVETIKNF